MLKYFRKSIEKIFIFFFVFSIFFNNLTYVYAKENKGINKNLTSLDLSFIYDYLKLCKIGIPNYIKDQILNLQLFEKNNQELVKSGNYNCNLLFNPGGGSSGGGATREFYLNNYENIDDFKNLVKEYIVRKSVNENTLNKLIANKVLMDNEKYYEKFKKWGNKILENYVLDDNKNLANYKKFTIKDIDIYYLKQDIEYIDFEEVYTNMIPIFKKDKTVWFENDENERGRDCIFTPRIVFSADEIRGRYFGERQNRDWEKIFGNDLYSPWTITWAMQNRKDFQYDEKYLSNWKISFYRGRNRFLMFGSNELGDPDRLLRYYDLKSDRPNNGTILLGIHVFYHKFLIKLPDGKFKIAYIADFDGNSEWSHAESSSIGDWTRTHFQEYFPMLVNKKSDMLYDYFVNCKFYDYDYKDGQLNNDVDINKIMRPYNINHLNNKDLINKLNNIEDLLNYLRNNLDYDKYFDAINDKLDNYDALLLNLDDKMNFIIDQLKNQKFFDYSKLNDLIKQNLEDFNKRYIENIKLDLNEIKNLIKENKIEIVKNQNQIASIYDTVLKADRINNQVLSEFGDIKSDLAYIKSNLKSSGQVTSDDDFKKSFFDKTDGKNRLEDSINFFDKFIKFFTDFFVITEKFEIKKLDTTNLSKKIPFSLLGDLKSIFQSLVEPPKVPVFVFPLFTERIILDFNNFKELAAIIRSFTLVSFVVAVMLKLFNKMG
jgi:hypothetical protein